MSKWTVLLATVVALVAMAFAGVALADTAGNSGNANCGNGGTTSFSPPGWAVNGKAPSPNSNAYNTTQSAFFRCTS